MHPFSICLSLLFALPAYIIFLLFSRLVRRRLYLAEAARRGCQDAPLEPSNLPFGIDRLRSSLKEDRKQLFPNFMADRFSEMGVSTFRFTGIAGNDGYVTYDPKNIQALLATQFHDFGLGTQRRGNFFPLLGNGIFTLDGKGWEHSRAMMRPQFAREQVSDLELEETHVQNLMRALPVGAEGWTDPTDLQVLFFRLTLDSATEFLFGESIESQIAELPAHPGVARTNEQNRGEKDFASAFDLSQRWLATRSRFQDKYWLISSREFRSASKVCHRFVDHFVQSALHPELKGPNLEKGTREKYVFLEALATQTRDPVELRSQMLNILLAGRDTTASLLGWLFYILVRDTRVFEKLRMTILDAFGTFNDPKEITFARLKACQYLQWCLSETLRLYPVVPINSRQALKDTTIPRGGGPDGQSPVLIKKGQRVGYSVYVMHRAKEYWGDDAKEFKPERWEKARPQFTYLPFNGGPRICIGQQFALTEVSYVAVRLLQRFDKLENLDTDPVVRHNLTLTNSSGTGVKIRMRQAKA
ncbi:MAG: hypothetical protein M1837_004885 [Sclerophora amabilis]|nr:MAG: hypothetical protein M1837_004885 [Sclerophora amabilis]